ncbi:hypothetical protein K438DRAFT_2017581 [Mycena galopus ATCC 62051]|nr:hypothetical protein K438DRAFT_2017581 [Mycena galopus ATCC 62051]
MKFTQIPQDVILEMTRFLDLHDSGRLLVTCSSFAPLLSVRDFWLKTLARIQTVHMQPLPCPIGTNIFAMPTDTLRTLAIRAYSLRRNWTTERAVPVAIRTIALGDEYQEICVISGANIVITNDHERLTCWNTQSGACVGEIELDADGSKGYDLGKSPPFHLPGHSFIALSSSWNSEYFDMMVVKIDYENPDKVTFSQIYSNTWRIPDCQPMTTPDVVVNDTMMGMAFANKTDQLSILVYAYFSDRVVHHVPLGVRLGVCPVCVLRDGELYIQGQDKGEGRSKEGPCTVLRVRLDSSRALDDLDRITLDVPLDPSTSLVYGNPYLRPTPNGVVMVARKLMRTELHPLGARLSISGVQFCSISEIAGAHPLKFVEPASYEHYYPVTHLVTGISGRCAVILDMEPRREDLSSKNALGVVQYTTQPTPRTSFHTLHTGDVKLNYYTVVLAVDDALGVVYATHIGQATETTLHVFSYA